MKDEDIENLLGGFATDTLTPQEREKLFAAALHNQDLFNALADDQALRELLSDPASRKQLLQALQPRRPWWWRWRCGSRTVPRPIKWPGIPLRRRSVRSPPRNRRSLQSQPPLRP
jgi:hypothetical protein